MSIDTSKRVLEVIVDGIAMPIGEQVEGGDYDIESTYLSNGNQKLKIYDADNLHKEDLAYIKGTDVQHALLNGGTTLSDLEYERDLMECYEIINRVIQED